MPFNIKIEVTVSDTITHCISGGATGIRGVLHECFDLDINMYSITMQSLYVLSLVAHLACLGKSSRVSICTLLQWPDVLCIGAIDALFQSWIFS